MYAGHSKACAAVRGARDQQYCQACLHSFSPRCIACTCALRTADTSSAGLAEGHLHVILQFDVRGQHLAQQHLPTCGTPTSAPALRFCQISYPHACRCAAHDQACSVLDPTGQTVLLDFCRLPLWPKRL